jgi:hypothetical protein
MKNSILFLALIALAFGACTKKRTSIAGFWKGSITAPASEGGLTYNNAFDLKSNGSMVYYFLKPDGDTANASGKGIGNWYVSGSNVTFKFSDLVSNHDYNCNATVDTKLSKITGTFKADVIDDFFNFSATVVE